MWPLSSRGGGLSKIIHFRSPYSYINNFVFLIFYHSLESYVFASPGPKTRRRNQSGGNNSDDSDSGVVVNEIDYKVSQTHFADFFRKLHIFDSQKTTILTSLVVWWLQ